MKKNALPAVIVFLVLLIAFPSIVLADSGFTIGPASVNVTMPADGFSKANVYITSNFDGEIVIGSENIPFQIEPETVSVESTDYNKRIELTFYGNTSVEEGEYSGKLTFLAQAGGNVAYGVKIKATVIQLAQEQASVEAESSLTETQKQAGPDEEPSSNIVKDSYIFIILGLLVVIALLVGILIGRRRKEEKEIITPKSNEED